MPTPLPLSPLQLKKHGFTTVRIQAVKGGSLKAAPLLKPTIRFKQEPTNANQWRLALTLQLGSQDNTKPFAYEAEIKLHGAVEIIDSFPPESKEQLALVNGFSILYAAAREMLLNVTSRSAYGPLTLPTLSFVQLVAEALKQKAEPPKTDAPAPA